MTDQNDQNPSGIRELLAPADAALPRLYVNSIAIRGGAFDLTLDLGYSVAADSPDQAPSAPEWLARVSMSWEHAGALMRILEKSIRGYEEQVGQLPDVERLKVQQ